MSRNLGLIRALGLLVVLFVSLGVSGCGFLFPQLDDNNDGGVEIPNTLRLIFYEWDRTASQDVKICLLISCENMGPSALETLVHDIQNIRQMEWDAQNWTLYYIASSGGSSTVGSFCMSPSCYGEHEVIHETQSLFGLAINPYDELIYWAEASGGLFECPIFSQDSCTTTSADTVGDLNMTATNLDYHRVGEDTEWIFWTGLNRSNIYACHVSSDIHQCRETQFTFAQTPEPDLMKVDDRKGLVYWAVPPTSSGDPYQIYSCPVSTTAPCQSPTLIVERQNHVEAFSMDPYGNTLYWAEVANQKGTFYKCQLIACDSTLQVVMTLQNAQWLGPMLLVPESPTPIHNGE